MDALPANRSWQPPCSHGTYQHKAITSRSRQLLMMRNKEYKKWHLVGFSYPHWITMHGQPHIRYILILSFHLRRLDIRPMGFHTETSMLFSPSPCFTNDLKFKSIAVTLTIKDAAFCKRLSKVQISFRLNYVKPKLNTHHFFSCCTRLIV